MKHLLIIPFILLAVSCQEPTQQQCNKLYPCDTITCDTTSKDSLQILLDGVRLDFADLTAHYYVAQDSLLMANVELANVKDQLEECLLQECPVCDTCEVCPPPIICSPPVICPPVKPCPCDTTCPEPPVDTDGDGVPDVSDACPTQGDQGYGLLPNGCPVAPPQTGWDGTTSFPGAVGFGRFTKGAYAGSSTPRILIVDNTNGSITGNETTGRGSFAWAVSRSYPAIVLFEVSGNISLTEKTDIISYKTILGQTAPSPGITIRYYPVRTSGHDIILQHVRFRLGDTYNADQSYDVFDIFHGYNIMIDHCTFTWGIDENFSINDQSGRSRNISITNCMISEAIRSSLDLTPHAFGSIVGNVDNGTYAFNLWSHLQDRAPLIGSTSTLVELTNNLDYNTSASGNNIYFSDMDNPLVSNVIGNVYIPGPSSASNYTIRIKQTVPTETKLYLRDNIGPTLTSDPWSVVSCSNCSAYRSDVLLFESTFTPIPASEVYEYVLQNVGARPWDRDAVDIRLINDVRNRTGRICTSQNNVGGWPVLQENHITLDIPLNPHEKINGITNLERWLYEN